MARQTKAQAKRNDEIILSITGLVLIAFAIIGFFHYGLVGQILTRILRVLFGQYPQIFFVLTALLGAALIVTRTKFNVKAQHVLGLIILALTFVTFLSWNHSYSTLGWPIVTNYLKSMPAIFSHDSMNAIGGVSGAFFYALSSMLFAKNGTLVVLIVLILIGLTLLFGPGFYKKLKPSIKLPKFDHEQSKEKAAKPAKNMAVEEPPKQLSMFDAINQQNQQNRMIKAPNTNPDPIFLDVSKKGGGKPASTEVPVTSAATSAAGEGNYQLPSIKLLDEVKSVGRSTQNLNSAHTKGQRLIDILQQFGIEAELIATHIGPSVTKFEIKPNSNVKISRIQSIQDNLMMELAVKDLRIEAPIPGRAAVGIEIPNIEMSPVRLRELLNDIPSDKVHKKLLVALGKDLLGQSIYAQLDRMPHLLIAGATGSGKSVCVNSLISSLLLRTTPDEVKLVLIDPKKVEFTIYKDVPHLICPVISDPVEASKSLKVIVKMMENRYDLFSKAGVRNISTYNEEIAKHPEEKRPSMPWIIVIIDELADLMSVAGKEVEGSIQRITQLARAAGIHLIVATQRPSVDVITGVIKANIPSRIAFAVSSAIDSRTILDGSGAEKLLGNGDMLYIPIGEANPTRIQGVYVSDDEVNRIADAVRKQGKPKYEDAFIDLSGVEGNEGLVSIMDDPLYNECRDYVIAQQKASTSFLQRRFQLGYNRAARIIDALEENRVIGPQQGSKPRDVYIKPGDENEELDENQNLF